MFGLLESPCYSPFSLGSRLDTYELMISLISKLLGGCNSLQKLKPWILKQHI
jgi:hypothetical protein